jgi:hypothetical protein
MDEAQLQEDVIAYMSTRRWKLYRREYEVIPGYSQYGKGDLWFRKRGKNVVVEVKTNGIRKVTDQARVYGAWVFAITEGEPVLYCTYVGTDRRSVYDQMKASEKMMTKTIARNEVRITLLRTSVPTKKGERLRSFLLRVTGSLSI